MICVVILLKRRSLNKDRNGLVFEIGNQTIVTMITGQQLGERHHYTFHARNNIDLIDVKICPRPIIIVRWTDFQITHILTDTTVQFQSRLPVSLATARRVAKIIHSGSFYVLPHFRQCGKMYSIESSRDQSTGQQGDSSDSPQNRAQLYVSTFNLA